MKWMGGWSVDDFNAAPPEYIDTILEMIQEEIDELERIRGH